MSDPSPQKSIRWTLMIHQKVIAYLACSLTLTPASDAMQMAHYKLTIIIIIIIIIIIYRRMMKIT